MEQNDWIMLNYTLPRDPSRARVSIWRRLKKIGAVNIQQSMWVLPRTEENYNLFNGIKTEITRNRGEAFVMFSSVGEDDGKIIVGRFNAARDEEYGELLEQCGDFFREIDKETERKNFTYAEIEENEEELNKLKNWYEKIAARDPFEAPLKEKSWSTLKKCAEIFEGFCDQVYEFNNGEKG